MPATGSKLALVPESFFDPARVREDLSQVAVLDRTDTVRYKKVAQYGAVLLWADVSGEETLPEMFHILSDLPLCGEYNKILCSLKDGFLSLAIAQGKSLLLANTYPARDFITAEYFIFLALHSLQLNPEVSTICWRGGLSEQEQMSLYRYFKGVEVIQ